MGSWERDSRDEDLALFHDMRQRERRNFLYPWKDDIDASPRRDEGFSTFCVSASTPTRGGHNLLPLDSEKNDYDWLLTPPSTPLFPSLDQDVPIVNLSQRRVLTRSASVSKTARLSYPQEPSPRIIYHNPSPRRPSTASSTSSTVSTNRGRPLSPSLTSRSSPTLRSSSPCRPTTPTGRNTIAASRSTSRSLTPTLRRNNTSPSSANRLGPTNGRSRGKSLSPKMGPWEPSLPGFSAEPPPNLRTTLSDRTIQRGISQAHRNGVRNRGSFAEASEGSSQSLGYVNSPDGDGNWSLSYGNDLYISQTSRASVVSSCDDDVDMAESVVSGSTRTSSDSWPKSVNVVSKIEDPSMRKCVLPAKRQMKPAGTTGDTMPFLSLAARKSYERQAAQRRSTQAMFRPLLSSAPITSFYSTRPGGMHIRSASSPSMESSAIQNGSSHLSRNESSRGEIAAEVAVSHAISENTTADHADGQEIIEKEAGGNSPLEGEDLECRSGLELRDEEGSKTLSDLGTPKEKDECAGGRKKDVQSGAQYHEQGHLEDGAGQVNKQLEVKACGMDADITGPNIADDGCIEGKHPHKGHMHSKEGEHSLEMSKVKEHHVEDHKFATSLKSHSYLGAIGNVGSQHGAQRVLSDLGSFRKQSPMKNPNTRSHDGSILTEKTISCDSVMSDSHSFNRSLTSAFSNGEPTEAPLECHGEAMEADFYCESTTVGNKVVSSERPPSSLESDAGVCSYVTVDDTSNCNVDSESYSSVTHLNKCSPLNQAGLLEDHFQVYDLISDDSEEVTPEGSSSKVGESLMSDANDELSQQDVLSIFGSFAPSIAMLEDGAVQHDCTEAPNTIQSRRFSDVLLTTSGLATDDSEGDRPSQGQVPELPLLKRSVTLEEATDTILFCSSIVHELVYKSATKAIENEEQKMSKPSVSKRDFVTLFGFSGAEHKANGVKAARPRNWKRQPFSDATVCEMSSFVQKQRMVHRQTPAVTMRQSPMDRIENAVMGNHEEIRAPRAPIVSKLQKRKVKQGKRVQCKCSCCMM